MNKKKLLILDFILTLVLIGLDQATKYIAVQYLKNQSAFVLIPEVLELSYLENRGAAFGLLQNQKVFFICMAVLVIIMIGYVLAKTPEKKKYTMLHITLVMIVAGGIGNMIDRIVQGYVVDFISFVLINFPTFNVADIFITVATFLLAVLILFVYKEEDFNFLSPKQKKIREM